MIAPSGDTGAEITIEDDGTIIGPTDGPSAGGKRPDQRDRQPAHPRWGAVPHTVVNDDVRCVRLAAAGKDGLLRITQIRKLHGGARIREHRRRGQVGDKIR
jgi:polyribonucleotide nucleotidyltransferase